jgi:hypothetical protein
MCLGQPSGRGASRDRNELVIGMSRFCDADEPWPRPEGGPNQNDDLYRYGLKLADPNGLERWREEQRELERRRAQERVQEEAREAEIRRQQQVQTMQADVRWNAWVDAKIANALEARGFNDYQIDVLGMTIAQERKQTLRPEIKAAIDALRDELRAEIMRTAKAAGDARVIDITPAPVVRRTRNDAA